MGLKNNASEHFDEYDVIKKMRYAVPQLLCIRHALHCTIQDLMDSAETSKQVSVSQITFKKM